MNHVTALGSVLEVQTRTSRNGVPYALGVIGYRAGGRPARLPLIAFGNAAKYLKAAEGKVAVLQGYLQEYSGEGEVSKHQIVVRETRTLAIPVARERGVPLIDGYARATVYGKMILPPMKLRGGLQVIRLSVPYPLGERRGETLLSLLYAGGERLTFEEGDWMFAEGGLIAGRKNPDHVHLVVQRIIGGAK